MRGSEVNKMGEVICDICGRPIKGEVFSPGNCHKECILEEVRGRIE